jgi:hypothetical protein
MLMSACRFAVSSDRNQHAIVNGGPLRTGVSTDRYWLEAVTNARAI